LLAILILPVVSRLLADAAIELVARFREKLSAKAAAART
jgi:hypothetical protein